MKKTLISLFLVAVMLFLMLGCSPTNLEDRHVTDPAQYGRVPSFIDFPDFFPESITDYTMNSYAYTNMSFFDVSYEVFLDITVDETQLDALLKKARAYYQNYDEREAYNAKGYKEIVFGDSFMLDKEDAQSVSSACIAKVVYNPETGNMIYEYLLAVDPYEVKDVADFNKFGIGAAEYEAELKARDNTKE